MGFDPPALECAGWRCCGCPGCDDAPEVRAYGDPDLYRCECGRVDIDGCPRGGRWYCGDCIAEGRPRVQPMEAAE